GPGAAAAARLPRRDPRPAAKVRIVGLEMDLLGDARDPAFADVLDVNPGPRGHESPDHPQALAVEVLRVPVVEAVLGPEPPVAGPDRDPAKDRRVRLEQLRRH